MFGLDSDRIPHTIINGTLFSGAEGSSFRVYPRFICPFIPEG